MPYIFDKTNVAWPEDGSEREPTHASLFQYLPTPEFLGTPEIATFSVHPLDQLSPLPEMPKFVPTQRPSGLSRAFGRSAGPAPAPQFDYQAHAALWSKLMLAAVVPAVRELGVKRLYCRYDGGNDEGFAWLESGELADGYKMDANTLVQRLSGSGLGGTLRSAGLMTSTQHRSAAQQQADIIRDVLASELASILLGHGFGTGEYSMYGAFTADLDACTITDDPKAEPIVQNIKIGT